MLGRYKPYPVKIVTLNHAGRRAIESAATCYSLMEVTVAMSRERSCILGKGGW
jgi:hypothetical protein